MAKLLPLPLGALQHNDVLLRGQVADLFKPADGRQRYFMSWMMAMCRKARLLLRKLGALQHGFDLWSRMAKLLSLNALHQDEWCNERTVALNKETSISLFSFMRETSASGSVVSMHMPVTIVLSSSGRLTMFSIESGPGRDHGNK